jgi:hypothetical protein
MQLKLPKSDQEYKAVLKELWEIDIDSDDLIGEFSLLKNGTQAFFINCITPDGKQLRYPDNNIPLRIKIVANSIKTLKSGYNYKFKAQFASLDKRIQLNPYLLVTQRNCIQNIDNKQEANLKNLKKELSPLETTLSLKAVISDIYNEKLNQNNPYNVIDLAEAVEALAIDIYSENKRFIYELIQNADDAALCDQSELMIEIKSGFIILSHNGKPFDEKDLRGLCGIGRGTKREDKAKTGYKGIGFKSVFGQKDGLVYVKTDRLLFRFDRQYILENGWNLSWGNQKIWENENQTNFKAPWQLVPIFCESTKNNEIDEILNYEEFTVKIAIKIKDEIELANDITELFSDARFLLFLRKIYKVTLVYGSDEVCIKKESHNSQPNIISLNKNGTNISNWYLRTGNYDIPADIKKELQEDNKSPKKLQEMFCVELSFAFKLEADLKSLSVLPSDESCIFTYLPTAVSEYGLPFLVNSNFLVDAGREKLHKDRIWNKWLFEVIGRELIKSCAEFATSEYFMSDYLKMLLPSYLPETDLLKNSINAGLKIGLENVPFILNRKNQLVRITDIIIDEVEILATNILPIEIILDFIKANTNLDPFSEENFLQKFNGFEKLKTYGAKTFSQFDLKVLLQSEGFLLNHKIENNYNLLRYLKELDENDLSGEWNYIIRNTPFIYTNDSVLEKIPLVCFPVAVYVTEFGSENTLINQELYNSFSNDKDLIKWLTNFGVKEPDEIAYLEKEIIGKINTCINEENFLDITKFILRLHSSKKIGIMHYYALRNLPLKSNYGWNKAIECFLPGIYNPTIDFPSIISGLTTVSADYIGEYNAYEWKTLFVAINVAEDINVIPNYKVFKNDNILEEEYYTEALNFAKNGHAYPHLIKDIKPFYITYFTFLNKIIHFNYSTIFWNRLISKFELSIESKTTIRDNCGPYRDVITYKFNDLNVKSLDLVGWGYYEESISGFNRALTISYFEWLLRTKPCIPTNLKTCLLSSDVYVNSEKILELGGEYIPIIQLSKKLSIEWIQLIGLKSKLSLADILNILSLINNDPNEKGLFKRENIKRLSLLYNELLSKIDELTNEEEAEIRSWATGTKILCSDYVSRKASEIIWLRIEGFIESEDKIPSIFIPKNLTINERFEKLISFFEVPIVDKCEYQVTDKKEDLNLFIKILEILPSLALILHSKMKIKNEEEYLHKTYNNIINFKFYRCKNILLILNHGNIQVKGSSVKYYLSDEAFYFTSNWQYPLERFNISHFVASLLKCNGLEQEIQLLLELPLSQINEYHQSVGLKIEQINVLPIYKEIQDKINSVKNSINSSETGNSDPSKQIEDSKHDVNISAALSKENEFITQINGPEYDIVREVAEFITSELEDTEWADHIPELKIILELSIAHPREKQKLFNLIAKLKLAKATKIHFDTADSDFNQLTSGEERYFVHSARGSFAYIHTNEILRMKNEGFKMALDFGSRSPIKIYQTAEEILRLNTSHLLVYQYEKTIGDLFNFCEHNSDANKHLLVIDRENSREKSNDIFRLLNPEDDYQ